jgi:hypothetical protein
VVFCRSSTNFRISSGTQSARQLSADVEFDISIAEEQSLRVCVDRNELNTTQPKLNHAINCVYAAATHTNDLDNCEVILIA